MGRVVMYQWNADKIVLPFSILFFSLKFPWDNLMEAARSVLYLEVSVIKQMQIL